MITTTLRLGLPPLPPMMAELPIDERGFPVPWFVDWIDGKPDHRVMDSRKFRPAVAGRLCWTCGKELGAFVSFVIGPMCSITRVISEPPSHLECARYACTACPFLTRPHAHRREAGMAADARMPAGAIKRNPAVVCVWTTRTFTLFKVGRDHLFRIGEPDGAEWYAEGRDATRDEVDASIATGLPLLVEQAAKEGRASLVNLREHVDATVAWLDAVLPHAW